MKYSIRTLMTGSFVAAFAVCCFSSSNRDTYKCDSQETEKAHQRIEDSPIPRNWVQAQLTSDRLGVKRLNCYSRKGVVLFEGDIVIGAVPKSHPKGLAINARSKRWPGRAIPYAIENNVGQRNRITKAMQILQGTGIVTFVPRTDLQRDYISFANGDDPNVGASPVGRQGGKQTVTLGTNCQYGVVLHEICHSLGLWHEQSRSDRDQYICVLWANIVPDMRFNFDQHVNDGENLGKYDYDSIMHYFSTAFSKDGRSPTIIPKQAGVEIGQQNHLSKGDVDALKDIFSQKDLSPN